MFGGIFYPDWEETCNLINTGNNHGCSMNKCRNRRWAFHCIRQPDMKWEHGTLTCTTNEHQEQGCWKHPSIFFSHTCKLTNQFRICIQIVVERANIETEEQNTNEEEQIGKASNNESLLRGMHSRMLWIIETNQQIRTNAHKFPEHIHLEDICSNDQAQHAHCEE